jgi:predicted transcriptional regulator of viral defense system
MGRRTTEQVARVIRAHGGTLRTSEAERLGVRRQALYRLRDLGLVVPVSRGVYRLADLPDLSEPDLVAVATRIPRAVVCLVSALALHEITNEIPHEVHVALPRDVKTPRLDYPPLRVFHFSGAALTEGVETREIDGVAVRVYGPEKSVADAFRFRNQLGLDLAIEALKLCLERKRASRATLLHFARICRVNKVMLPYLEALQ